MGGFCKALTDELSVLPYSVNILTICNFVWFIVFHILWICKDIFRAKFIMCVGSEATECCLHCKLINEYGTSCECQNFTSHSLTVLLNGSYGIYHLDYVWLSVIFPYSKGDVMFLFGLVSIYSKHITWNTFKRWKKCNSNLN